MELAVSLKQKQNETFPGGQWIGFFWRPQVVAASFCFGRAEPFAAQPNLLMERRVLESFAGRGAALIVAPALPTEMPPDRWRKFVVIEGGKARPVSPTNTMGRKGA